MARKSTQKHTPKHGHEDSGSGKVGHERAARTSAHRESWVTQLRRALGFSKGRPKREPDDKAAKAAKPR